MRWIIRLIILAALTLPGMTAGAAEPYDRIAVRPLNATEPDDALAGLIARLAAAARSKDRKALAPHVHKQFFWDRDFGGGFDARAPAVKNFETALSLNESDLAPEYKDIGWERLRELLAARSFTRHGSRPGVVCAPGAVWAEDEQRALQTANRFASDFSFDWAYMEDRPVRFHGSPESTGEVLAELTWQAVRVLDLGSDTATAQGPPAAQDWIKVHLPSGKEAYARYGEMLSFLSDRLCYGRSSAGGWHIAGYVGGGD